MLYISQDINTFIDDIHLLRLQVTEFHYNTFLLNHATFNMIYVNKATVLILQLSLKQNAHTKIQFQP